MFRRFLVFGLLWVFSGAFSLPARQGFSSEQIHRSSSVHPAPSAGFAADGTGAWTATLERSKGSAFVTLHDVDSGLSKLISRQISLGDTAADPVFVDIMAIGEKLFLFYSSDFALFAQELDRFATQPLGAPKRLLGSQHSSLSRKGNRKPNLVYSFVWSPDNSKLMIVQHHCRQRHALLSVGVYDRGLQAVVVPEQRWLTFGVAGRETDYSVANDGSFHLVTQAMPTRKLNGKGRIPRYTLHSYSAAKGAGRVLDLSIAEIETRDVAIRAKGLGELLVARLIGRDNSLKIRLDRLPGDAYTPLTASVSEELPLAGAFSEQRKGSGFQAGSTYAIRSLLLHSGGAVSVTAETVTRHHGRRGEVRHPIYTFGTITAVQFDHVGAYKWVSQVHKEQVGILGKSSFVSYRSAAVGERLWIVYSDHPGMAMSGLTERTKAHRAGQGFLVELDGRGRIVNSETFPLGRAMEIILDRRRAHGLENERIGVVSADEPTGFRRVSLEGN